MSQSSILTSTSEVALETERVLRISKEAELNHAKRLTHRSYWLGRILNDVDWFELRAIKRSKYCGGYKVRSVLEAQKLIEVLDRDKEYKHISMIVNPVNMESTDHWCCANDILERRWVVLDIDDPDKGKGMSTVEGIARCVAKRKEIEARLANWGKPWVVFSGNGFHLYYRSLLERTRCLDEGLKILYEMLEVDEAALNVCLPFKVAGVGNRKGEDESQWRYSCVVQIGDGGYVDKGRLLEVVG
jgi:hypothetical protein